jgi:hypothetical protein
MLFLVATVCVASLILDRNEHFESAGVDKSSEESSWITNFRVLLGNFFSMKSMDVEQTSESPNSDDWREHLLLDYLHYEKINAAAKARYKDPKKETKKHQTLSDEGVKEWDMSFGRHMSPEGEIWSLVQGTGPMWPWRMRPKK